MARPCKEIGPTCVVNHLAQAHWLGVGFTAAQIQALCGLALDTQFATRHPGTYNYEVTIPATHP